MRSRIVYLFCGIFILFSCSRKKKVDIDLPPYTGKMVVECYLEPGSKYRLALYESVSYLNEPKLPLIYNAEVYIVHRSDTIELFNALVERTDTNMGYNYMSNRRVPFDYGSDFYLHVKDSRGRVISSVCSILKPLEPSSIGYGLNDKGQAYMNLKIEYPAENYFRVITNKNYLSFATMRWEKRIKSEGIPQEVYSPYVFMRGDSVIVTFVTLEKTYYDFLHTFNQAAVSSVDPFSQPVKVKSNINGGLGIFAGYSYVRKKVYMH